MRISSKPVSNLYISDYATDADAYDTLAAVVRKTTGVSRLSPKIATEIRQAITRHRFRAANKVTESRTIDRLRESLRKETEDAVAQAFSGIYRTYADDVRVETGSPQVRVKTTTKYVSGRRGFGHVTDGQTTTIRVVPAWRRKVRDRGLAVLDGLMTTHAELVSSQDGIEVYRAEWIRQGRGYELASQSGAIAYHRASGTSYHFAGATICDGGTTRFDGSKAVSGLRRKMRAQAVPTEEREANRSARAAKIQEKRATQLAGLVDRIARWDLSEIGHVVVSRSDSLRAGNCEPGTDEFIERFGQGKTEGSIAVLAERIGRVDPETLSDTDLVLARQVAAACLVAVRRDRASRRPVLS